MLASVIRLLLWPVYLILTVPRNYFSVGDAVIWRCSSMITLSGTIREIDRVGGYARVQFGGTYHMKWVPVSSLHEDYAFARFILKHKSVQHVAPE